MDLNSEFNYSLCKLKSLSTATSSDTMQSNNHLQKIKNDEDEDHLLSSSQSIYDNLSIYTLNNGEKNATIDADDTDNDKESIISNYDDHIYEQLQLDFNDSNKTSNNHRELNLTLKNDQNITNFAEIEKDNSLDSIFNRLSLECEKTIEQCRIMIQSVSSSQTRRKYNKNLLQFNKNSLSSSSSSSISSSSLYMPPLIADCNRKTSFGKFMMMREENSLQNYKKKKKFRKKISKTRIPITDEDESNEDKKESLYENRYIQKSFQKRRVKNCFICEKRSLSCAPNGSRNEFDKSIIKSPSNSNYKVNYNKNFQVNSIYIKFPAVC